MYVFIFPGYISWSRIAGSYLAYFIISLSSSLLIKNLIKFHLKKPTALKLWQVMVIRKKIWGREQRPHRRNYQNLPIFPAFVSFSLRLLFWRFPVLEGICFTSDVVCDSGVWEGEAPLLTAWPRALGSPEGTQLGPLHLLLPVWVSPFRR